MAFEKGHNYGKGRPKNSQNKNTSIVKDAIAEIMSNGIDEFIIRLKGLNNKDYVTAYLSMAKYVIPQLKSQEIDLNVQEVKMPQWLEDLSEDDEQRITDSLN
jgi:hypothetical protein